MTLVLLLGRPGLAWDEEGKDDTRIRVIEAWPCAKGESPAPIIPSRTRESFWPKTVDEAADRFIAQMSEASKARLRSSRREDLILYLHGAGTGIRNTFGLWGQNNALRESCGEGEKREPEACSMVIIERAWERLQPDGGGG